MPPADTPAKREALFWNVCLPARAVFAASATLAEVHGGVALQVCMSLYLFSWAVGLLINFARGLAIPSLRARLEHARGAEREDLQTELYEREHGNFGGRVWWQWYRLAHGAMLLAYAMLTLARVPYAYAWAVADVILAALAGTAHFLVVPDRPPG